jgi:mannose-1-phosphate guanylyltransferase
VVGDEDTLEHGARQALAGAAGASGIFMLGLEGLAGSRDCGWILPMDTRQTTFVYRFFEKPPSDTVRHLLDRDALVSAFIFASRVQTLLDVVIETMPVLAREFLAHRRTPGGVVDLMHLYDAIGGADFSRAVFQQAPHHLLVVRVPECGWVDLGTPEHLLAYLGQHGQHSSARGVAAA